MVRYWVVNHRSVSVGFYDSYRALSWSHDAWALIALIALLSTILVLGNIVLVLLIRITRAPRAQVFL